MQGIQQELAGRQPSGSDGAHTGGFLHGFSADR